MVKEETRGKDDGGVLRRRRRRRWQEDDKREEGNYTRAREQGTQKQEM